MEQMITDLLQLSGMQNKDEICHLMLEGMVKATESELGYIAFPNKELGTLTMYAWSEQAMKECAIVHKPIVYYLDETGLWGDPIRYNRSIITNDYTNSPHKKGYPVGHVSVRRHLGCPLIVRGDAVMLAGMGNKKEPYDELDIKKLILMMHCMWGRLNEIRLEQSEDENKELVRSNEELQKFAYVASHDLKAPLRAMSNLATWIADDIKSIVTSRLKESNLKPFTLESKPIVTIMEYVKLLKSRVGRMESLIDGLLEISRVGRMHKEIELVDTNKVVIGIKDELDCGDKLTISNVLPTIHFNKVRITQVLSNLISNAFKHHHDINNASVVVSSKIENEFFVFCVADNGPGIDPKFHEKIFEIFQTLKPRDDLEATGIGLSIAKKIVEDCGGSLWVESDGKNGSNFYFRLPKVKVKI